MPVTFFLFFNFSSTGCVLYPLEITCFGNKFDWALSIDTINNLNFQVPNKIKFPSIKLLKKFSSKISLYDTVLVAANDELVHLFLKGQIKFTEISIILKKILELKEFSKYKQIIPTNYKQIYKLSRYVRLKTFSLSVLSQKC